MFKNQSGQSVVEYMLLLSAVVAAAGLMSRQLLKAVDGGIVTLGGQLEKDLKTGRAPLDIWQN